MSEQPQVDMKVIYRLLREVQSVARHASMTRQKGTPILTDTYNRCLGLLAEQGGATLSLLFESLPRESASVDDVGAAAALLASYMEATDPTLGVKKIVHVRQGGHPGHPHHPPDLFDLDEMEPPTPPAPPTPPMPPGGRKE